MALIIKLPVNIDLGQHHQVVLVNPEHHQLGEGEYPDHKVACRSRLEGGWNDDVTARRELKPDKYICPLIS